MKKLLKKTSDYTPREKKDENNFQNSLNEVLNKSEQVLLNLDIDEFQGSVQSFISNNVFVPCDYLIKRRHAELTSEDYVMGFTVFEKILEMVNQKTFFSATPLTFSKFMNVSSSTLKQHADQNNERGDIVRRILDYLTENHAQNMLSDKFNAVTGIFTAKSLFGLRDNENPNVNITINQSTQSLESILKEYNMKEIT